MYPYSVVPGGVLSAAELRWAVTSDPVVRNHYQGFGIANARFVPNHSTRQVYVSFRYGGQVYWTRRRVVMPSGEMLISDGTHEIRTRCGNRISETPEYPGVPAEVAEPTPEEMEISSFRFVFRPNTMWTEDFPNSSMSPTFVADEEARILVPVETPEPSTMGLVALAICILLATKRFRG